MYSKDFREKILKSYKTGKFSYKDLSEKFEVSEQFLCNLMKIYKKTGEVIENKKRIKSVNFKLDGKYETILLELIKEKPSITLLEISDYFKENHGLSVGKSSVDRKLRDLKITVKKREC